METVPQIGFVGFGEAAFHIAKGLREAGVDAIAAFDINMETPTLGPKIRERAREAEVRLVRSNAELAEGASIVVSAVTCDQAMRAAEQTQPHLTPRHFYADINSVSPATKQSIGRVIDQTLARFVEIAVMAPVPPYGHRVPILAGGVAASDLAAILTPFGMRIEIVSQEIGLAAATKMFRSVVVKGLEALLTECVLAADRYGAVDSVLRSLKESYPGINWAELTDYAIGRVVVHGERRAREMDEVAETIRSLDIEPIMAEAAARRMDWSAKLDLKRRFGGEAPAGYRDLTRVISEDVRD
jgi:3-hydroxyisobutyrate dehydrogenase-like beta-hydroxyacid dehydrogenase